MATNNPQVPHPGSYINKEDVEAFYKTGDVMAKFKVIRTITITEILNIVAINEKDAIEYARKDCNVSDKQPPQIITDIKILAKLE